MTAAVGFYVPGETWLYRLDPRAKLWIALLGIGLCLITARLELLASGLLIAHLVLMLGGLPAGKLIQVWRRMALLLAVILILQPLLSPGADPAILQAGPLRITQSGILLGCRYALRVAAAAFFVLIPIMTTPINRLVRGMQKVGLPYVWGAAIGLALRYLGTIGELYEQISQAQAARGLDAESGNVLQRVRNAVPTLIALVIASLRLIDSLALGMAARGFGLRRERTWRGDITMSAVDWAAVGFSTAVFAALIGAIILL